jgi:hypothetical protein
MEMFLGYCNFLYGNLVACWSKEQSLVTQWSSTKTEFRAMTQKLWTIVDETSASRFEDTMPYEVFCDNN